MKNLNFGFKNGIIVVLLLGTLSLIACQKSGNGDPVQSNPNVWTNCAGCVGGNGPGLLNVHAATPDEAVVFSLNVQAQPSGFCAQPSHKLIICAQGPATLTGSMFVQNNNLICGAALGEYQVRPLEFGTIGNAMIMGGRYEAINANGSRIIMRLQTGIMSNADGGGLSSVSPNNRIAMGLMLESVNGYACGIMSTY